MDYSIDKQGVVMIETRLPEFCADCDSAEWWLANGELYCGHLKQCEQLFAHLSARHAKKEDPKPEAARPDPVETVAHPRPEVSKAETIDRLEVDEAQAERSAEKPTVDFDFPVEWWKLPNHLTLAELGACAGVSRNTAAKAIAERIINPEFIAWAVLPTNGKRKREYFGWMVDAAALAEWKAPAGRGKSKTAKKDHDDGITWRWNRGYNLLQIAREMGLSRRFVSMRVREIFGVCK